jgi:hypothetical protein
MPVVTTLFGFVTRKVKYFPRCAKVERRTGAERHTAEMKDIVCQLHKKQGFVEQLWIPIDSRPMIEKEDQNGVIDEDQG